MPHAEQWVRSAISEYVVFVKESSPVVHVIAEDGKVPNVRNEAPESLRQVLQWQLVKYEGTEELEYLMLPHWHPPVRTGSDLVDIVKYGCLKQ